MTPASERRVDGSESQAASILCFDDAVPATIYARSPDVLWRAAPDRVVVRWIGHDGLDLVGTAAMVWIALDRPSTMDELATELADLAGGPIDVGGTVGALVDDGLVVAGRSEG